MILTALAPVSGGSNLVWQCGYKLGRYQKNARDHTLQITGYAGLV